MRIARRNLALALVFVGLAVAYGVGGDDGPPLRPIERLAPGLTPREAARIELRAGERRVVVAREGERWLLPDLFGFPAEAAQVERLLERLVDLTTLDLVTEDPERHAGLGLGASDAQHLVVQDGAGATVVDVHVARAADGFAYVRPAGQDAVYGYGALPPLSTDVQAWRKAEALVPLDVAQILRVEGQVRTSSGELQSFQIALDPSGTGRWQDQDGRDVDRDAAEGLVRGLVTAFPERILAATAGPEFDQLQLEVRATRALGGAEYAARIAAGAREGLVPAVGAGGDYVLGLRPATVQRLTGYAARLR